MKAPIPIVKPCSADWSQMTGDDRKRLCAHCDKHVHNLSALTPRELNRFVEQRDGTECIGYVYREDGTIETAPRWGRLGRLLRRGRSGILWLLAAMLPSLFASCTAKSRGRGGATLGMPLPGEAPPLQQNVQHVPKKTVVPGAVAPRDSSPSTVGRAPAKPPQ